jgi:hypothetical protein
MARTLVPYICPRAVFALKDARRPHMNSSIEDLRKSLSRTFNVERHGGSVVARDDSTLMLLNYNLVHLQLIDAVKTQYPNVEVYFENYSHSTSGYVVFFVFKSKRALLTSSELVQFLCLGLMTFIFHGVVLHTVSFSPT